MRRFIPVIVLVCIAGPAAARTWQVPSDVETIDAALERAESGDEVVVACGTYVETGLYLPAGVVLRSESGDPACVVIDAPQLEAPIRVLTADHADGARIVGLTIMHGQATYHYFGNHGGALSIAWQGTVEVEDCVFVDNVATYGGAIAVAAGANAVLRRCTITGNHGAYWSGGVTVTGASTFTAENCAISTNTVDDGWADGLCSLGSWTELICCTIDTSQWGGDGTIEIVTDDCGGVATKPRTWGAVKSLHR